MNDETANKLKLFYNLQKSSEGDYFPDQVLRNIDLEYYLSGNKDICKPLYITWNITNSCNLNCFFCSARAKHCNDPIKNSSTLKIANKIIESECVYISLLGGEPTLNTDILECVKLFNSHHIFTEIVTNGVGINEHFVEEICKLEKSLIRIKLSLDSCNEEVNDKIRGKGAFRLVKDALRLLASKDLNTRLQMVVCENNKNDILSTYKFAQENNCKSFGFSFVMPIGRGIQLKPVKINEGIVDQLIEIKKFEKTCKLQKFGFGIDGFEYFKSLNTNKDSGGIDLSRLKCSACRYRLNLDENGDIYPCDMLRFPEFKLGNILKCNKLSNIFNKKVSKKIRQLSLRQNKLECKNCKNTWCNTGCLGMCIEHYKSKGIMLPMCRIGEEN